MHWRRKEEVMTKSIMGDMFITVLLVTLAYLLWMMWG
jgi:hypothetical protein